MGMLSKLIAANLTTRIVKRLNSGARDPDPVQYQGQGRRVPRQQYIPARPTLRDRCVGVAGRCNEVVRQNPKTFAALGALIAAAAVQQAMKRR